MQAVLPMLMRTGDETHELLYVFCDNLVLAQAAVLEQFRSGQINTIVATSVGEEGLDIAQVDLIVCFDAMASPTRMIQVHRQCRGWPTSRLLANNLLSPPTRSFAIDAVFAVCVCVLKRCFVDWLLQISRYRGSGFLA